LPTEEVDRILNDEIGLAEGADTIICVTEAQAKAFRDRHLAPVYVLGHSTEPRFDAPGFEGRHGFLFVGRLLEQQAPNWHGLKWFIREVWPLIRSKLPDATLIVAGHLHPDCSELEALGVRLVGPVADLHRFYDAARVFVVPAHFAAGVPIKILEATAAGLPTAATSLMARQLGWAPGVEIAVEDEPMSLAAAAVALHEERSVWGAVRAAAQQRIAREYSAEAFRSWLRELLDGRLAARL
jgi:glycosyltransferase involved in cell wall biosynthesis